jgi:hypothetical protein
MFSQIGWLKGLPESARSKLRTREIAKQALVNRSFGPGAGPESTQGRSERTGFPRFGLAGWREEGTDHNRVRWEFSAEGILITVLDRRTDL